MKGKPAWNKGVSPDAEMRARISATLMGNVPWNKGKKTGPQDATVVALRAAKLRGRKRPPEVGAKISATKRAKMQARNR